MFPSVIHLKSTLGWASDSNGDFSPEIFKFNGFCGLMPLTTSSVSPRLDGSLRLRHAIWGTIKVNGWKLQRWKQRVHGL